MPTARGADRHRRLTGLAFAGALVFLLGLQAGFRAQATDGVYFQECSSEHLMQTVSVADLRAQPWRSLYYLHIQPPLLDGIRAVSARLHPRAPDLVLVRRVDADLYRVWAVVYAALIAVVFRWLAGLASPALAGVAAAVLAVHPASIYYATLLDSTLLSAAVFTWLCYELWRWSAGRGSVLRLAGAAIACFLTRSVFQWPFLLVLAASLALLRVPWRRAAAALGLVALAMALYIGKQYAVFGVTMTSTFAGYNFCRGLGVTCRGTTPVDLPALPPPETASVLSRPAKLDGQYNYNQLAFLERSFSQMAEYHASLREQRPADLAAAWRDHLIDYLRPSSLYTSNVIVDRLPWRRAQDAIFSGWPLAFLVLLAGLTGLVQAGPRRALALALPTAYVIAVTIVFEGREHLRYKFFVEPVLFVLMASQAMALGRAAASRRRTPAYQSVRSTASNTTS